MILTCSRPTSRVNDHDGSVCTGVYPAIACREMSVLHEHDKEHGRDAFEFREAAVGVRPRYV